MSSQVSLDHVEDDRNKRTSANSACSGSNVALAFARRLSTCSIRLIASTIPMCSTIKMRCHRVDRRGACGRDCFAPGPLLRIAAQNSFSRV
jgi:hypothetical protein